MRHVSAPPHPPPEFWKIVAAQSHETMTYRLINEVSRSVMEFSMTSNPHPVWTFLRHLIVSLGAALNETFDDLTPPEPQKPQKYSGIKCGPCASNQIHLWSHGVHSDWRGMWEWNR